MKKRYNQAKPHRSFRRFVRQLFSSFIKRQELHCGEGIDKVFEMLREIKESIEIIAQEIARQAKRGE